MRVIARVHDEATDSWTNAEVACLSGFAEINEVPIFVTDLTDGRAANGENFTNFARGQAENRVGAIRAKHLSACSGSTAHLSAFPRLKFNVMDEGSIWDVGERAAVADFDIGDLAADDLISDIEVFRTDDVALLAVGISQQCDEGGTVWIVFDSLHGRWDVILVATEVDDTITVFVATADVTAGDDSLIVTPAGVFLRGEQRFFRSGFGDFRI